MLATQKLQRRPSSPRSDTVAGAGNEAASRSAASAAGPPPAFATERTLRCRATSRTARARDSFAGSHQASRATQAIVAGARIEQQPVEGWIVAR